MTSFINSVENQISIKLQKDVTPTRFDLVRKFSNINPQKYYNLLEEASIRAKLNSHDIEVQLFLQLPRYGFITQDDKVIEELYKATELLCARVNGLRCWLTPSNVQNINLEDTKVIEVPESDALIIHQHFHYIGSPRENSKHIGLTTKAGKLCALLSFSKFDLNYMFDSLPFDITNSQVLVLSRAFAFDWAPHNKMSFLMAKAFHIIENEMPQIKMILTYVNPNLGFTGASYRATNWKFFGEEEPTIYSYLDKIYITERQLMSKFGTSNSHALKKLLDKRFDTSHIYLQPLQVFSYFLDKETRNKNIDSFNHKFIRPNSDFLDCYDR